MWLQTKKLQNFMADGHFLTGLARRILHRWRDGLDLADLKRRVDLLSIQKGKRRAICHWKALLVLTRDKRMAKLQVAANFAFQVFSAAQKLILCSFF